MKILEIITHKKLGEQATAGATSACNIEALNNPHVAAGPDRFKKSYTGTPGRSGTTSPKLPKIVQPKNPDGTAKGAHNLPGVNLMGGPLVKR